mmetsp:Transcript_55204/g.128788  ORF Transcript_55204/g.128788 Transcript_55204/m.128788 type:complete len:226 (-) Transcript_55204:378-1055(-)
MAKSRSSGHLANEHLAWVNSDVEERVGREEAYHAEHDHRPHHLVELWVERRTQRPQAKTHLLHNDSSHKDSRSQQQRHEVCRHITPACPLGPEGKRASHHHQEQHGNNSEPPSCSSHRLLHEQLERFHTKAAVVDPGGCGIHVCPSHGNGGRQAVPECERPCSQLLRQDVQHIGPNMVLEDLAAAKPRVDTLQDDLTIADDTASMLSFTAVGATVIQSEAFEFLL